MLDAGTVIVLRFFSRTAHTTVVVVVMVSGEERRRGYGEESTALQTRVCNADGAMTEVIKAEKEMRRIRGGRGRNNDPDGSIAFVLSR